MAYTVGHMGIGRTHPLSKLLLTAYGACSHFFFSFCYQSLFFARIPIKRFLTAVAEPATIAFATSTSEAALPRAMECMEAFGVPRRIVAFVIPAATALILTAPRLPRSGFDLCRQAAGIHMSWPQQLFMVLLLMLTSKGIAGVPRASLLVLMATSSCSISPPNRSSSSSESTRSSTWPATSLNGHRLLLHRPRPAGANPSRHQPLPQS